MFLNRQNIHLILFFFILTILLFVNCVPQSVLINKKETKRLQTNKVKRAPFNENLNDKDKVTEVKIKEINDDESNKIGNDVIAEKLKLIPKKRGVPNQYYNDGNNLMTNLPYGFWEDNDNAMLYPDLQEQPSLYNSEQLFTDLMPLQIGIPSPYYSDKRRKRSNGKMSKKFPMHPMSFRNKRNSKLTPSIVTAIAQAGMQARANPELYKDIFGPVKTAELIAATQLLLPFGMGQANIQNFDDFTEWANYWIEPTYGYQYEDDDNYGYDMNMDRTFNQLIKGNRGYPAKRFMVAKKKQIDGGSMNNNNNDDVRYGQERFFSEPSDVDGIPENDKYYSLADTFVPLRRAPRI